jgi:type III restriction enzyme
VVNYQPVEQAVLVNHLRDQSVRIELGIDEDGFREPRLENYILRGLNAKDDISYDDHAELLNALAGRVIAHLRSYLPDDDAVGNVVRYYQRDLVRIVYQQLEAHHEISATAFVATAIKGVQSFGALHFKMPGGHEILPYRSPVADLASVKSSYFDGFRKCLYADPAVRLGLRAAAGGDPGGRSAVLRWLKPERGRRIFHIYLPSGEAYYPDFAVETTDEKLVVEVKRADQLDHPLVEEKARAAITWCGHATAHERAYGGKPWRYVLIPHDAITSQMTMAALVARYAAPR